MLGDSVRRRLGRLSRRKPADEQQPGGGRWTRRHWAALGAALLVPFLTGYLVAVRVLFPAPAVVAGGVAVPDIVGRNVEAGQRELTAVGLGPVQVEELPSAAAAEGIIIAQSPLPGQQLRNGSPVRVAISSGPPRVFVPDVAGFPIERAASLLTRLGFQVQRTDAASTVERGRVLRLDPAPGNRLELPARVLITVSAGMPDTASRDTTMQADSAFRVRRIGWSRRAENPMFTGTQAIARQANAVRAGRD